MKIEFVFGFLPVFVFFADSLGEGKAGEARGPIVRILKSYADDVGLLEHELTHARQWYFLGLITTLAALLAMNLGCKYWQFMATLSFATHSILYMVSPMYRLWSEVQAYQLQAKHYLDDRLELFACFISTRYSIDVSKEEVLRLLKNDR